MLLLLRSSFEPANLTAAAVKAVHSIDPDLPVHDIATMDERLRNALSPQRSNAALMSVLAGVGLALSVIGIFGVLSYSVTRRAHEIGIRMALGARREQIVTSVLGTELRLAAAGVVLGSAVALVTTRGLRNLLYGVSATDPLTFTAVSLFFLLVAAVASYIPAHRAASMDPMRCLRHEYRER